MGNIMTRQISEEQQERERKEIEKGRKKRKFIGHIVRKDPNIDKEDTRPIEKQRKADFSVEWKKMKEVLDSD